jgi:hypothetical protein
MTASTNYVPGVCNINTAEIKQRRNAGYFGIGLFIIMFIGLVALDFNQLARLTLFVPAFIAAIGLLQAQQKFCVGYGAAGLQNADEGNSQASQVAKEAAAKDKARARRINMQAAGIAVVLTAIAVALPF